VCEARFYGEEGQPYYAGFRGPKTKVGYLVGFEGFELDPCQDTRHADIRVDAGMGKARDGREAGDGKGGKGRREGAEQPAERAGERERGGERGAAKAADKDRSEDAGSGRFLDRLAGGSSGGGGGGGGGGERKQRDKAPDDCVVFASNLDLAVSAIPPPFRPLASTARPSLS